LNLIDSNILIYSSKEEYAYLRDVIISDKTCFSEVSKLEVLGYHRITDFEKEYFTKVFSLSPIFQISSNVIDLAISIRKQYNLGLADAIIGATGLLFDLTILTRNIKDFEKIVGLNVKNPVE
jgi:predicted nucleic acid-binding protein